jgi:hypothetical protein
MGGHSAAFPPFGGTFYPRLITSNGATNILRPVLGFSSDEEKCIRNLKKQPPGKSFSETDFWYQTCQHQNGQQAAEAGCALLSCLLDYFSKIKSYGPSLASFPGQSH